MRIRLDNPAQLGGELLCAAVAALKLRQPPLIVMNLDTATTLGWISAVVGCLLVVEYGFLEPLKREVERWREAPR